MTVHGSLSPRALADVDYDALQRRPRRKRSPTGKRVTPQPRDLLWFRKLHEHGPLSSTCLHAFSKHLARSEKRARDRLTDLFHETRTPHGGAYLDRPWQQFQTLDARYQDLVYDLGEAGGAVLAERELIHVGSQAHNGPWWHRYMVACITASIELATIDDPGLAFIPQHDILARAGTGLRCAVPFIDPGTGKTETRDLIPDALFGLEYARNGTGLYRFFAVEADRGTEPTRAQKLNRKSHLRNFLQYRNYVGRDLYKKHLKLTAPMLVLNITTSETTMQGMMTVINEMTEGAGSSYQLFQTAEAFRIYFKPPKPISGLLTDPWLRPNHDAFRIGVS